MEVKKYNLLNIYMPVLNGKANIKEALSINIYILRRIYLVLHISESKIFSAILADICKFMPPI